MRHAQVLELGSTKPPLLLSSSHLLFQGMDTPLAENFLRLLHAHSGSGSAMSHIGCGEEEGARHRTAIAQKVWIHLQLLVSKHQLHLLVPFLPYPHLFWGKRPHDDQRSHDGHLQPPASLPGPIPWRRRARSEARARALATHPKEEADTRVCPFVYCHSNTKNPSQYNVQLSSSDSSSIETDYQVLVGFF